MNTINRNLRRYMLLASVVMAVLVGCGGGSSSTSNATGLVAQGSPSPTPVAINSLQIIPPVASVVPNGTIDFTSINGKGAVNFTFSTNNSGGSISSAGIYTAGAVNHVTDIITATDSNGNVISASVLVGPIVTLSPAALITTQSLSTTFTATGGTAPYNFQLFRNQSSGALSGGTYTSGPAGSSLDILAVADSNGNTNFAMITVASSLTVNSAQGTFNVSPNGQLSLSGSGGTAPYSFFYVNNSSNGGIGQGTGTYTAGPIGGGTDVVMMVDNNFLHVAIGIINVGASLSITPSTATANRGQSVTFTSSGGTGTGLKWTLKTNASGGSINSTTGVYTAGQTPGTDTVQVTDSLGNVATTTVSVGP